LSKAAGFSEALLQWHGQFGRHDLPWQHPRSPYRVWVSEIMLQQTQVQTVIPYFTAFMARFPTLPDLAKASESAVMNAWAGLGYYSRARNLHQAAKICMAGHGGELPRDFDGLLALPGIGRTTAGAILSQAHGQRFAIVDGNVKRVLTRFFAIGGDAASALVSKQLWLVAESLLPETRMADYSQAIMDLGATLCTRSKPACAQCPLSLQCQARQSGTVLLFPGRKAIKKIPQREKYFLIMISAADEILLERRPANGIWGGLHSLPETDDSDSATRLARQYAAKFKAPDALAPMEHVFSHFRLTLRPLLYADCTQKTQIADNDAQVWVPRARLSDYGLPAPIKKLLGTLP
jgi:A/G-specific adenine glycosylase